MAKRRLLDKVLEVSPGPLTSTHLLPLPRPPQGYSFCGIWGVEIGIGAGVLVPKGVLVGERSRGLPGPCLSQEDQLPFQVVHQST